MNNIYSCIPNFTFLLILYTFIKILETRNTLQAKSRENAGFNRGTQSAIATLPNGEQIVLMLPAKRRRGSKYAGGLS